MLRDLITLEVGGLCLEDKRSFSRRRVHHIQSLPTFLLSLVLRYCGFSEADIPRDIGSLSLLRNLDLSGSSFLYLPFDFSKLPFLMSLLLNDCENLQTLPSVSNLVCLRDLEIANCEKLVKITELDNLPSIQKIKMVNCSSLQNPFKEGFFSAPALALSYLGLNIDLQSNEIPDWCSNQVTASSICFTMPTHNKEYKFLGMILWCVRYSGPWDGWGISIDGKMPSRFHWQYEYEICAEHAELSCVQYRTNLMPPFYYVQMKGGEKMEVFEEGKGNSVKKIGIHLLYLDQHGNVTSLPAIADHSHSQMMNKGQENKKSLSRKEPKKSFKQRMSTQSLKKIITCFKS